MRRIIASVLSFFVSACGSSGAALTGVHGTGGASTGTGSGTGGTGGVAQCPALDGGPMTGMPLDTTDSDGDGLTDCAELACGSNPDDPMSKCYACGWKHNDPGNLKSNGAAVGDVVANLDLIDQCNEHVKLWDFAREYHILFMTAAW